MSFSNPAAFLLAISFPYWVWLGWPRKGPGRWRERASLGLRLLIGALLVLSLAGTQIVRAADELAVVFMVDASDSVGPEQTERAEEFVRQAIESMGPTDQAAVVLFGANSLVDRPMSGLAELAPVTSVPETLHTNIAEAIRLGLALFPPGSARRIVLLSDGAATLGDTLEAARLASAAGVQVDVLPLSRISGEVEALITSVDAPTRVGLGESFTIEVTAESNRNTSATLQVFASGAIVYQDLVQLRPGTNHFPVRLRASQQEFARYQLQLVPQEDVFYQNNQLAAFTEITGPPRILVVAPDGTVDDSGNPVPDESPQLRLALEATSLVVDRATPSELPASLAGLGNYASVVLVNVNAKNLSPRKMQILQSYVRDLGGGLVVVGGPESYGMGGYYRTELEETLPVNMQIMDQDRFPSVSIALVIDRSGSMSVQEGGVTKIQLAAEGAVRVVELLNDFDEITVIPVDTQPDNPIGPASAATREDIIAQVRQIGAGGGGIYVRTGLEAAAEALAQSSHQVKHVIVLADGADSEQKEGVPELIEALTSEGVTVSTVSIGDGPDVPWLRQMAELGGGRFHFTDRAANLPQIFTQETTSIQRTYLVEERFFPALSDAPFARRHAIFRAMETAGLTRVPALFGYVGTSPKATAQTILETHFGDPLLAAWEYGLGRAVAWTSDATGRWASEWVRWQGFPSFWSNVVRWTISQGRNSNVELDIAFTGREADLTVSARDSIGSFLNNLSMDANVISPKGETTSLTLQQVAPGRYEASFVPSVDGAYFVRVTGRSDDEAIQVAQTGGWVLGYSPEYLDLEANPQLLTSIAQETGGRDLSPLTNDEAVQLVFAHDRPSQPVSRPIWAWLLLLATVLLPFDIAIRRLAITQRDVARAWGAISGRLQPKPVAIAGRTEQVSRLFQAKRRAGTAPDERPDAAEPSPIRRAGEQEQPSTDERPTRELPRQRQAPAWTAASETDRTLAARLLERKRRQQASSENDTDQE